MTNRQPILVLIQGEWLDKRHNYGVWRRRPDGVVIDFVSKKELVDRLLAEREAREAR